MKRMFLRSILALVPAALISLAAAGQVAPTRAAASADKDESSYKYEAFAGYGYTSLNQLNGSLSGLQGVELGVTRNMGKYFGIIADGAYYSQPYRTPVVANSPLKPNVSAVFFGPEVHGQVYTHTTVFLHGLLGGEHVGGESMTPNVSFAGGLGGGIEYGLTPHLSLRAAGDDIASSFSLAGNSPALGYSPHRTRSSRATFGVAYRF